MTSNEKFELQSCSSRRKLQFPYKFYPHLNSYQKVLIFLKEKPRLPPRETAVGTRYSTRDGLL
jgi:hypothetical protein